MKALLLGPRFSTEPGLWDREPLAPRIDAIAAGSFKLKQPPEIRGRGYVADALEAALWAFWGTDDFEAGALAAVNLGDDADTTGAIYGQLAGAYSGLDGIPKRWRRAIALGDQILTLADGLLSLAQRAAGATDVAARGSEAIAPRDRRRASQHGRMACRCKTE